MRVLVACEMSGRVRDAFIRMGHDAVSCDIVPSLSPGPHIQRDVLTVLSQGWDVMVAFPPCTHLATSGARWFPAKRADGRQAEALAFVRRLLAAPVERVALENPVGVISSAIRRPDQIVQPFMFGDEATKTTCLWLKNLPALESTKVVGRGEHHVTAGGRRIPSWYNLPDNASRPTLRAMTFPGMAEAMAAQWGAA